MPPPSSSAPRPSGPPSLLALKALFVVSVVFWLKGHGEEPAPPSAIVVQEAEDIEVPPEEAPADLGQYPTLQFGNGQPSLPWKKFHGTRSIPDTPYPWQRHPPPPCTPRLERLINGGCWTVLSAKPEPDCPDGTWQAADGCFWPAVADGRMPTSLDGGTK